MSIRKTAWVFGVVFAWGLGGCAIEVPDGHDEQGAIFTHGLTAEPETEGNGLEGVNKNENHQALVEQLSQTGLDNPGGERASGLDPSVGSDPTPDPWNPNDWDNACAVSAPSAPQD